MTTLSGCGNKSISNNASATKQYMEFVRNQDYENAHLILDDLYSSYESAVSNGEGPLATASYGSNERYEAINNIKSSFSSYNNAAKYIYSSELRFLSTLDEEESWKRALFLIKELPVTGIKYDESTKSDNLYSKTNVMIELYIEYVNTKNSLCDLLLDLAIDNKKNEVADRVINYFVENCVRDDEFAPIYYCDTDIQKAKDKYNKAIDKKLFN